MSTSDDDRIRGTTNDLGGSIKEGLGNLTGDDKLVAEGRTDQAKGKMQKATANVKDAVKDVLGR